MDLRLRIESAVAVKGVQQWARIVSADDSIQTEVVQEIERLQIQASSSATSTAASRTKIEENSLSIASIEARLAIALKEEAAANAALGIDQNNSALIAEALSSYQLYKMRAEAAKRLAEDDDRRVNLSMKLLLRSKKSLYDAVANEKVAFNNAAHSAWHGTISGTHMKVQTQAEKDDIAAEFARIRAT